MKTGNQSTIARVMIGLLLTTLPALCMENDKKRIHSQIENTGTESNKKCFSGKNLEELMLSEDNLEQNEPKPESEEPLSYMVNHLNPEELIALFVYQENPSVITNKQQDLFCPDCNTTFDTDEAFSSHNLFASFMPKK